MFDHKSQIFRYFLLCFVAGVAIRSFFAVEFFILYLFGLVMSASVILFWSNKTWRYLFLGGILIALGIFRYQLSLPQTDENKIWFYSNQQVNFTGVVIKEPDIRINHTKLTIKAAELNGKQASGKVLVNVGLYPEYQYGDLISINCKLRKPEPIEDFSYDRYLAKEGIYAQCVYPKIELISQNYGNWFLAKIFKFKNKLEVIINNNLPEPPASLFAAIILGARRGIPQGLMDKFNLTGTTHLIAISGFNMQLALIFYIPRKKSFWLITFILVIYVIIVGFPASAVRAAIMGWLVIFAMYVGRLNQSTNALILAGSVMILVNPSILRDDVGFQLSFCAVLGLIYLVPFFERWFLNLPSYLGLKESLQLTLAAQLATLPLIVYNFGRISLISPIVNLLVVPIVTYLTVIGFGVLFLSLVFSEISQYLFWPVWLLLSYVIKVIGFFAGIPGSAIDF